MKRKLCLILSCILLLAAVIPTSVFASDVSLFNNNTSRNYTSFTITDSGEALKALFAEFGDLWHEIFKTITTDNGSEFALLSELEDEMLQVYIRTLPAKRVPTSVTTVCYGGSYPRAKAFTTTPPTISASLQIASMVCQGKSSATPRPKNSLTCTSTASTPRDCA